MSETAQLIAGVVLGVVLHELGHALAAVAEGDPTPAEFGRLTPAPWRHMDLVGSLLVPALTFWRFTALVGWCRPVPVTRALMRDGVHSWIRVSLAGPFANFMVAAVAGVCGLPHVAAANLMMGAFNLLPIPGFDGMKIIKALQEA